MAREGGALEAGVGKVIWVRPCRVLGSVEDLNEMGILVDSFESGVTWSNYHLMRSL